MNVHNIMEDVVSQNVNVLYDQVKEAGAGWLSCDCMNCRLDTVSYVLNRIAPKYIVSGRGASYANEALKDQQLIADVNALALEGMRIVSSTKRPFHTNDRKDCSIAGENIPSFNFPTFTGTVLDGSTFEPVVGATVTLKQGSEIADMIDKTWYNPYTTCKTTRGNFSFLVKSVPAEKAGIQQKFTFTFEIAAPGYETVVYSFDVPAISEGESRKEVDSTFLLKIKDFIIFKSDIENPME